VLSLFAHLQKYDPSTWRRAVEILAAEIHPVDRDATRIWFAFYPLELHLALEAAPDYESAVRELRLMGKWRLADQINESHRFLYGHRYWPQVKLAIENAERLPDQLSELITVIAEAATRRARVDRDQLLGITAAGLMTLRQVGVDVFASTEAKIVLSMEARAITPHQVLSRRAKDDWQGVFGFTRGMMKRWTVTFDENEPRASFPVINGQEVASAAKADRREYRERDPRCTPGEGPIPVECRAGSCGTCWVGVLGGREKLTQISERDEAERLRVFGYTEADEPQPLIRLACQAKALGAVSVVIPPWNGMIGKIMYMEKAEGIRQK
jgi:ferredoxin